MIETQTVLQQIDHALGEYTALRSQGALEDLSDKGDVVVSQVCGMLASTLDRLAPSGTHHRRNYEKVSEKFGDTWQSIEAYVGALMALRRDFESGYLQSVEQLVHADTFAGFLEMAAHLQSSGYKDAAAVIGGSVLEQHLRGLCLKNSIEVMVGDKYKKAEVLNAELAASLIYSKLDQKNVTSWLGLRNDAAHGNYDGYGQQQVRLLIDSISDFLTRNPA